MIKKLMPVFIIYLAIAVAANGQYRGTQRYVTTGAVNDTVDASEARMLDSLAQAVTDSLDKVHAELDSLGWVTVSGGTVAAGYACFVDSTDTLRLAKWDEDYLNRASLVGISAGVAGKLRVAGKVAVDYKSGCTSVGRDMWLGGGGLLVDSIPNHPGVWRFPFGKCAGSNLLFLDPGEPMRKGGL